MKIHSFVAACVVTAHCFVLSLQHVSAGFTPFVIRGTPSVTSLPGGGSEIVITVGGQKAALGSSDLDGQLLGDITTLKIDRLDDA
ncbi:hypothetical protein, partial [Novipirellula maiorica]